MNLNCGKAFSNNMVTEKHTMTHMAETWNDNCPHFNFFMETHISWYAESDYEKQFSKIHNVNISINTPSPR